MALVRDSGAGPPLAPFTLTPKSPSAPPGLWLALRMMPPIAWRWRIRWEAAGVERMPLVVSTKCLSPWAQAMRAISWMARGLP